MKRPAYVYFVGYTDITGRWQQSATYRIAEVRQLARRIARRDVLTSDFRAARLPLNYYRSLASVDWPTLRVIGEDITGPVMAHGGDSAKCNRVQTG